MLMRAPAQDRLSNRSPERFLAVSSFKCGVLWNKCTISWDSLAINKQRMGQEEDLLAFVNNEEQLKDLL